MIKKHWWGVLLLLVSFALAETPPQMLLRAKTLQKNGVYMEAISLYNEYLKVTPNDSEARILLVELLLELKQRERATEHIIILRKELPNDPRVLKFSMIAEGVKTQKRNDIIKDYEARVKSPNASPSDLLEYARFLSGINQTERCIEMYKRYLSHKSGDQVARLELAKQYGWAHRYGEANSELGKIFANSPDHAGARLFLGEMEYWQGKETEALEQFRRVLKVEPKNKEASKHIATIINSPSYKERTLWDAAQADPTGKPLIPLAQFLLEKGREWEADSIVKVRLTADAKDTSAIALANAIETSRLKRLDDQIEAFRKKLETNPTDTSALLNLARYYQSVPRYSDAIGAYDKYLERRPNDYPIRLERAKVLNWAGKSKEATEEFRIVTTALPGNRDAQLGLANSLLYGSDDVAEAEQIFRSDLTIHPDDVNTQIGLAEAVRRQGNFEEARVLYNNILKVDSLNSDAKQGLTMIDQDISPLIFQLEKKLKADPTNPTLMRRLAGLYLDSKRFYEANELVTQLLINEPEDKRLLLMKQEIATRRTIWETEAIRQAKLQVQLKPDDVDARIEYAKLLAQTGQATEAVAQYRLVLERRRSDPDTQIELASILADAKQYREAGDIYRTLADENPMNFEYRYRYAQVLSWSGDNERAISEFERALRLNPESAECQMGIANAYFWKGDVYSAYESYNRVLALNPRSSEARKALQSLNGPLFRGFVSSARTLSDNSNFFMREALAATTFSFNLRTQAKIGTGTTETEQDGFRELGWFGFGALEYSFDKLTQGSVEYRNYQFEKKVAQGIRLDVSHNFKDVPELVGFIGRAYYSKQEAMFDLGATKELQTWGEELTTEKIGVAGTYEINKQWTAEGEVSQLQISDRNTRTEMWFEAGYLFKPYLTLGGRVESVDAKKEAVGYWAPKDYSTVGGWIDLHNSFPRWYYTIRGGVGRVQKTNDAIKNMSGELNVRVSKRINVGLAYSYLRTIRTDGEYSYSGVAASAVINL
ncbi:MAG: tetratricopeptide repeat protein [bacterium]|nr:tetratricopeptide repeat protein [bacterium]